MRLAGAWSDRHPMRVPKLVCGQTQRTTDRGDSRSLTLRNLSYRTSSLQGGPTSVAVRRRRAVMSGEVCIYSADGHRVTPEQDDSQPVASERSEPEPSVVRRVARDLGRWLGVRVPHERSAAHRAVLSSLGVGRLPTTTALITCCGEASGVARCSTTHARSPRCGTPLACSVRSSTSNWLNGTFDPE